MVQIGTLPFFCYDNTHSDTHVSYPRIMNESGREEPIKEKVSNENGEHSQDEVTYLSLSGDDDFASETISR